MKKSVVVLKKREYKFSVSKNSINLMPSIIYGLYRATCDTVSGQKF